MQNHAENSATCDKILTPSVSTIKLHKTLGTVVCVCVCVWVVVNSPLFPLLDAAAAASKAQGEGASLKDESQREDLESQRGPVSCKVLQGN